MAPGFGTILHIQKLGKGYYYPGLPFAGFQIRKMTKCQNSYFATMLGHYKAWFCLMVSDDEI